MTTIDSFSFYKTLPPEIQISESFTTNLFSLAPVYNSFSDLSSSISALFWFSSTATLFSRHLMYSFFFRRHSLAASLFFSSRISLFWCPLKHKHQIHIFSERFFYLPASSLLGDPWPWCPLTLDSTDERPVGRKKGPCPPFSGLLVYCM